MVKRWTVEWEVPGSNPSGGLFFQLIIKFFVFSVFHVQVWPMPCCNQKGVLNSYEMDIRPNKQLKGNFGRNASTTIKIF